MSKQLSTHEVAQRIAWEGGVLDAIEYGISHDQIDDPGLRTLWRQLEMRYKALTPIISRIEERLERRAA